MLKKVAFTLCVLLLPVHSSVEASRLGNPSAVLEQNDFAVSGEFAYVEKDVDSGAGQGEITSQRALGKISYGLHDRVEIFMKAGVSDMETSRLFKGDFRPAYGGGIKYTLFKQELDRIDKTSHWKIGVMGQFMHYESEDSVVVSSASVEDEIKINEWDIALGASYTHAGFTPYAGVHANIIDGEESVNAGLLGGTVTSDVTFDEDDTIGVFVGADVRIMPQLKVGVEGRFIDQTTISGEVSYTF